MSENISNSNRQSYSLEHALQNASFTRETLNYNPIRGKTQTDVPNKAVNEHKNVLIQEKIVGGERQYTAKLFDNRLSKAMALFSGIFSPNTKYYTLSEAKAKLQTQNAPINSSVTTNIEAEVMSDEEELLANTKLDIADIRKELSTCNDIEELKNLKDDVQDMKNELEKEFPELSQDINDLKDKINAHPKRLELLESEIEKAETIDDIRGLIAEAKELKRSGVDTKETEAWLDGTIKHFGKNEPVDLKSLEKAQTELTALQKSKVGS